MTHTSEMTGRERWNRLLLRGYRHGRQAIWAIRYVALAHEGDDRRWARVGADELVRLVVEDMTRVRRSASAAAETLKAFKEKAK